MAKIVPYFEYTDKNGNFVLQPPVWVCLAQDGGYDVVLLGKYDSDETCSYKQGPYKRAGSNLSRLEAYELQEKLLRERGLTRRKIPDDDYRRRPWDPGYYEDAHMDYMGTTGRA